MNYLQISLLSTLFYVNQVFGLPIYNDESEVVVTELCFGEDEVGTTLTSNNLELCVQNLTEETKKLKNEFYSGVKFKLEEISKKSLKTIKKDLDSTSELMRNISNQYSIRNQTLPLCEVHLPQLVFTIHFNGKNYNRLMNGLRRFSYKSIDECTARNPAIVRETMKKYTDLITYLDSFLDKSKSLVNQYHEQCLLGDVKVHLNCRDPSIRLIQSIIRYNELMSKTNDEALNTSIIITESTEACIRSKISNFADSTKTYRQQVENCANIGLLIPIR